MAMAWIWTGMAVVSVVCGAVYGRMEAVSAAALEGAGQAVRLCLSMAGMLCLWTGLMEVMDRCGLSRRLGRLFRPVLRRLLPQRQDFVATWRYLAHYAGKGTLTEQPLALSNRIARTFGLPCGCSRTLICLDVLQERGLIDLAAEPEVLRITLRQVEQKVDLDDSSILRQLRQLLQDS